MAVMVLFPHSVEPHLRKYLLQVQSWCLSLLSFLQRRLWLLPWLLPRLLLTLLLLLLLLLLDGVELDRPWCPPRNGGDLNLLVHGTGVPRRPVAASSITNSDRVRLNPRSGRLGGSLLSLGPRRLSLFWRRRGRLARQGTGRGTLGADRWSRVGTAYKTQNKG